MQNLKPISATNPIVDKCIECGYCEQVCPSAKLNLTPRQRIVIYRKLAEFRRLKQTKLYNYVKQRYKKYAVDSCATTGLCANHCPVNINTGELILQLKQKSNQSLARILGNHFAIFVKLNKVILKLIHALARLIGKKRLYDLNHTTRKIIPLVPVYLPTLPLAQTAKFNSPKCSLTRPKIVYLPSCNNRIFADASSAEAHTAVEQLLDKLGYAVIFPAELENVCCGQLFNSAGYQAVARSKSAQIVAVLAKSDYPIIIDNSSCFNYLKQDATVQNHFTDVTSFIFRHLDKLNLLPEYQNLAVHIDCSSIKLGQERQILDILSHCATTITIPQGVTCCGFAGSKGFIHPELNRSALSGLAEQISACDIGVTCNRNCQIGLSFHGQKPYLSLAEVVLNCIAKPPR